MDLTDEQRAELDKPFTVQPSEPDALVVSDEPVVADATGEPTPDPVVATPAPSDDDSKVPYSRFKKFHDAASEAKAEAAYWRGKAEALENQPAPLTQTDTSLPDFWVELYGDSDASVKAWRVQEQANKQMIEQARTEALEAVRAERGNEAAAIKENEQQLDENFEALADTLGRALTGKEQDAVLDIVDDYTPKDADGNYLGAVLPFDKAWEIYELRSQAARAPKVQARDQVASLTSTGSQGDTSISKTDETFNALDWNAWKKRL